jgi:predicted nucleotidyltransferase component of viral defense system
VLITCIIINMDAAGLVPVIERFHLLFLAQFSRRVDKGAFVVKGGCNLRFFHRSIRYSEDMDLDVGEVELQVLRDKVREVIASRPFTQILEARVHPHRPCHRAQADQHHPAVETRSSHRGQRCSDPDEDRILAPWPG